VSTTSEFKSGDVALLKKTVEAGVAIEGQEYVIVSGPIGPSKFYKVAANGGRTDHFAERDLIHKPQQADRLAPVKWKDCAWQPEILR
jgi:hypothetical protein